MVIDFLRYAETAQAEQTAFDVSQKVEKVQRASLEWVLADLLADIEAA